MAVYDALTPSERDQIASLIDDGECNASVIARIIGRSRGAVSNFARESGRPLQQRFACKVCLFSDRPAVDAAVLEGMPYLLVAETWPTFSKEQIRSHGVKCLGHHRGTKGEWCKACAHPERSRVDAEILARVPASSTSRWSGLGQGTLHRHGRNCLGRPKGKAFLCRVCTHPEVDLIDRALLSGTMRTVVAVMFDLPLTAVRYHWERHAKNASFQAERARFETARLAVVQRWAGQGASDATADHPPR